MKTFSKIIAIAFLLTLMATPMQLGTQTAKAATRSPLDFTLTSNPANPVSFQSVVNPHFIALKPTAGGAFGTYPKTAEVTTTQGTSTIQLRSACAAETNGYTRLPWVAWDRGGNNSPSSSESKNFNSGRCQPTVSRKFSGGSGRFLPIDSYGGWGRSGQSLAADSSWMAPVVTTYGTVVPEYLAGNAKSRVIDSSLVPQVWKQDTLPSYDSQLDLWPTAGGRKNDLPTKLLSSGAGFFRMEFDLSDAQFAAKDQLSLTMQFTADDFAKVYFNGVEVATKSNSAQSNPLPTYTLPAAAVTKTQNVIAFQVNDQAVWDCLKDSNGCKSRDGATKAAFDAYTSDSNKAGLWFKVEGTFDGSITIVPADLVGCSVNGGETVKSKTPVTATLTAVNFSTVTGWDLKGDGVLTNAGEQVVRSTYATPGTYKVKIYGADKKGNTVNGSNPTVGNRVNPICTIEVNPNSTGTTNEVSP
jgi:hypothetical protein